MTDVGEQAGGAGPTAITELITELDAAEISLDEVLLVDKPVMDAAYLEASHMRRQLMLDRPDMSGAEARLALEALNQREAKVNRISARLREQTSLVRQKQRHLFERVVRGEDDADVEPLLLGGLILRKGRVGAARRWVNAVSEAKRQLETPDEPFLFIRAYTSRALPEFTLGLADGSPAELSYVGDDRAWLAAKGGLAASVTHKNNRYSCVIAQPDKPARLPIQDLGLDYDPRIFAGEAAVKQKIEKLFNWWCIGGSDSLGDNAMLFIFKAAHSLGHAEFMPDRIAEFVPQWKAQFLRVAAKTLINEVSGQPATQSDLSLSYLEGLADCFAFTAEDIESCQAKIGLAVGRLACRFDYDVDEKQAAIPSLLQRAGVSLATASTSQ